jgi:hypothetical protein
MQVAENAIDLAASRGVLSRAAVLIDQHRSANPASDGSADELGALFAEAQAAKAFVNEAAARAVDRALALSGGAGYVNGSPLARIPRRQGGLLHASARPQPRVRPPRPRRARRSVCAALRWQRGDATTRPRSSLRLAGLRLGGVPAESADVIDTVYGSLPLIVAVIAITTFVRLAVPSLPWR